jgi:4-methylaminobutanoate oxidase (formaldehyde-forming)
MSKALPTQAQVVIVGGGIAGCNLAYHLAQLGWRDVVVLERQKLSSGTTWHSAGNVTRLVSGLSTMRHFSYAAELYSGLEKETGQATGWRQCGRVMMARTPERMAELRRLKTQGRTLGIDIHEISPREVKEKLPLFHTDDLLGTIWSPTDGRVNPTDVLMALVKGARTLGVRFVENVGVTGFRTIHGRVAAVVTDKGDIACEAVVNCCGLWGRQLGALAGVNVPLYAAEHFYMLTKPIKGVAPDMPTFRDPDGLIYGREDVGGLLVGCFDVGAKALPVERIPGDFSFSLLNEDWDQFEPYMKTAIHRIPALETAEVRMLLNGPESFTPDGNALVGEAPELKGFFVLAGLNSAGVTLSPSTARVLAEWIVTGAPTTDVTDIDIRRFGRFHGEESFLRARVTEMPSSHFFVHDLGLDFKTGRNLRLSPFHDRMKAHGASFAPAFGWEQPVWFRDNGADHRSAIAAEYRAAKTAVALFDRTSLGKILVQGRDAGAYLQTLAANDVSLAPGEARATAFLNSRAGVESTPVILRLTEDEWLVVTGAEQSVRDLDWIVQHAPSTQHVAATPVDGAWAGLGLRGPGLAKLFGALGTREPKGGAGMVEIGYATARAVRGAFGDDWLLLVPSEFALALYDAIVEAGAAVGLVHAGSAASETLRIADGRAAWGIDVSGAVHAHAAALAGAVDVQKQASFLGCGALSGKPGATSIRRCFALGDAKAQAHGSEPILHRGKVVGVTTSAAYLPDLGRTVVMGYVPMRLADQALSIEVECREIALKPHSPR